MKTFNYRIWENQLQGIINGIIVQNKPQLYANGNEACKKYLDEFFNKLEEDKYNDDIADEYNAWIEQEFN